jgi:hypothetical protein
MTALRATWLSVPCLVFLACGGQTVALGPGDGGGGDGQSQCPAPAAVQSGASCSVPGLTCDSPYDIPTCDGGSGGPLACTCDPGGQWQCEGVGLECPAPLPTTCPPPAQVTSGSGCFVDPTVWCTSPDVVRDCDGGVLARGACQCLGGTWTCSIDGGVPLCCPDAGQVLPGQSCSFGGQECPGNPSSCGGAVLYDALQCQSGVWVDVVPTICEVDAGDGGVLDAQAGD